MADEPTTPWHDRVPSYRELIDLINASSASEAEKAALREAAEKAAQGIKDGVDSAN